MHRTDICIAGAGIIGLSLALELHARGLRVTVVEGGAPLQQASTAAAGMLAANDPHNPAELSDLSHLSVSLYPGFLERLAKLGGITVPFQTSRTLQTRVGQTEFVPLRDSILIQTPSSERLLPDEFHLLKENSLDPRQLASAILAAATASSICLLVASPVISTRCTGNSVEICTANETIEAANFVDCTGAWAHDPAYKVVPIKGQMLAVELPAAFPLSITVRTSDIYIVPRTTGPNAGRAIIGATIEDVGFDKTVHSPQIEDLRRAAVALLPQLGKAPITESWSGLRPAAADRLPLLGLHPDKPHHWVASGHYRNGILLAPATAHVMTQLLFKEMPSISVAEFSPSRHAVRC